MHGIEEADQSGERSPERFAPENEGIYDENKEIVHRALSHLPYYEQEACMLRYYMDEEEIGVYQKRGMHSAKRSVLHGIRAIKEELKKRSFP